MTIAARLDQFRNVDSAPLPVDCHSCPVRQSALCGAIGGAAAQALSGLAQRERIAVAGNLSCQDEPSPVVGVVRSGLVQLTARRRESEEQIVGVARGGEFIGRPFGGAMPYAISAATDAELCLFPRDAFDGLAVRFPDLGHALLTLSLDELERTRRWLGMLGKKTSAQKVAAFLAEIAGLRSRNGEAIDAVPFELPFTRQQIADILGLTLETVSRQFTVLRTTRAIRLLPNRRVAIADVPTLLALAGENPQSWH